MNMSEKKLIYPAVFRRDNEDLRWWNVTIPDVPGAVTCGDGLENARLMAIDLLKCIYETSPWQLGKPSSIETTRSNFPNEIVENVELTIADKIDMNIEKETKSHFFMFKGKMHEVVGSLVDYRTNKIYVLDSCGNRAKEVIDIDIKYKLLQIARLDLFENICKTNKKETIVLFADGSKAINKYELEISAKILDRNICSLKSGLFDEVLLCLSLGNKEYICIEDNYDKNGDILKVFGEKICFSKKDEDFDFETLKKISVIFQKIDDDFKTGHAKYTLDYLNTILKK